MRSSTFYNCLDDVKNQPEFCNSKESKTSFNFSLILTAMFLLSLKLKKIRTFSLYIHNSVLIENLFQDHNFLAKT